VGSERCAVQHAGIKVHGVLMRVPEVFRSQWEALMLLTSSTSHLADHAGVLPPLAEELDRPQLHAREQEHVVIRERRGGGSIVLSALCTQSCLDSWDPADYDLPWTIPISPK
jgi:small ligand-binding sensory domain FIST